MREAIQELIDYLQKRIFEFDAESEEHFRQGNYSAASFKDGVAVGYRVVVDSLYDILREHENATERRWTG